MSENEASSLAAELSRDEDLPPFLRLKNDLRVAVQVLRVDPERKTRIFIHFQLKTSIHFEAKFFREGLKKEGWKFLRRFSSPFQLDFFIPAVCSQIFLI